ncbi:uncharacterized protein K460DRAFT_424118, partial [Cucurbitaria berberidis CBS 394.84]
GNGAGCTNCRQAGIDPALCQFHRVGSDNVHKVMDNFNMANSLTSMANANGMMTLYSATNPLYSRNNQYPQIDTKPIYPSVWTGSHSEDTSPVDTYTLEQPATYVYSPTSTSDTDIYTPASRWTHPIAKPLNQGTNAYFDQGASYLDGLPYDQPSLGPTTTELPSPLNMTALQLSLPERPRVRQLQASDSTAPQRQLPVPQPSPAQGSRNVVDQLQGQRLRSTQTFGVSAMNTGGSFARPSFSWGADGDDQINVSEATPSNSTLTGNTEDAISYLPTTTTSIANDVSTARAAPQVQLNFTNSTLLESMNASAPATTYSHFRAGPPRMARQSSQANLYNYSFNPERAPKRNSLSGDSSSDCKLVSGQTYIPLDGSQPHSATFADRMLRGSLRKRDVPLHRASTSNIRSSF